MLLKLTLIIFLIEHQNVQIIIINFVRLEFLVF